MSFSKSFCSKKPFKNVEKPAKQEPKQKETPMSEKVGVIIGEGAPEMSSYEYAADTRGEAAYIPTGQMYANMFSKIGQAVADIDANKKKKEEEEKRNTYWSNQFGQYKK